MNSACSRRLRFLNSCATCRLSYFTCPGHFGHIELPAPVFHPLFMVNAYHLLRGTCLFCHRFKVSRFVVCSHSRLLPLRVYLDRAIALQVRGEIAAARIRLPCRGESFG